MKPLTNCIDCRVSLDASNRSKLQPDIRCSKCFKVFSAATTKTLEDMIKGKPQMKSGITTNPVTKKLEPTDKPAGSPSTIKAQKDLVSRLAKPKTNPTSAEVKPNTVPLLPTDWSLLGLVGGYDPKLADALRLYILGPYNEGKTTFAASIPSNIILDFEDGANAIVAPNSVRIHIRDYAHFEEVIKKLVEDTKNKKKHWNRVTFDSIEEFIDLIKHQLEVEKNVEDITDHGSRGHGYNLILQRAWSSIMDLEQAGYAWAIVGHQKIKTEMNPATKKEEAKIREAVFPGVAAKIKNKSDFQLTIYRMPKTIKTKVRNKLATGQIVEREVESETNIYYASSFTSNRGDGKSRGVPTMDTKFEVPLVGGWEVFKKKYDAAVDAARKEYQ